MERILKRIKESLSLLCDHLSNYMKQEFDSIPESAVKPSGRNAFTTQTFKSEITQEPGKPRIIGGMCEFCGILADNCTHYAQKEE